MQTIRSVLKSPLLPPVSHLFHIQVTLPSTPAPPSSYLQTWTPVRTFLQSWIAPMASSQHLERKREVNDMKLKNFATVGQNMQDYIHELWCASQWEEEWSSPVEFWPDPRPESSCSKRNYHTYYTTLGQLNCQTFALRQMNLPHQVSPKLSVCQKVEWGCEQTVRDIKIFNYKDFEDKILV